VNTLFRLLLIGTALVLPLQAQQQDGEKPEPQGLADCEKTPAPKGYRWEYDRGAKECGLRQGELERCAPGWVCKNSAEDYFKGNRHLIAMKESSLLDLAKSDINTEEYRFTWLRTFHHPVVIRISLSKDTGTLIMKMSSGEGGYSAGHLELNKSRTLTSDDANYLRSRVDDMHFWDMFSVMYDPNVTTLDGSNWTIEGVKNGKYHFVSRSTPDCDNLVRIFGLELMIQRAHLKLLYQNVY
jgi:hypothetical protein